MPSKLGFGNSRKKSSAMPMYGKSQKNPVMMAKKMVKGPDGKMVPDYAVDGKGANDMKSSMKMNDKKSMAKMDYGKSPAKKYGKSSMKVTDAELIAVDKAKMLKNERQQDGKGKTDKEMTSNSMAKMYGKKLKK